MLWAVLRRLFQKRRPVVACVAQTCSRTFFLESGEAWTLCSVNKQTKPDTSRTLRKIESVMHSHCVSKQFAWSSRRRKAIFVRVVLSIYLVDEKCMQNLRWKTSKETKFKVILKGILSAVLTLLGVGTSGGGWGRQMLCEHGNETSQLHSYIWHSLCDLRSLYLCNISDYFLFICRVVT
jgi:hypothetical protein